MILESLSLQNFRSYAKKSFAFSPATTLIIGPNTAGKTNILEAIMFLATGKSFRADMDREVIRWGSELSRIGAEVGIPGAGPDLVGGAYRGSSFAAHPSSNTLPVTPSLHTLRDGARKDSPRHAALSSPRLGDSTSRVLDALKLEMMLTTGDVQGQKAPLKKFLVNGVARRQVDFVGNLRAVLFWPEHLELVTDSPSLRRKYLDSVLVQVDREYRRNLYSYERGLRQRNRLLDLINEGKAHRHQLGFWDQLLIKSGGYLTEKRGEYLEFVNSCQLSAVNCQLVYDKSVISESRLAQYSKEEVAAKATLVGPHRDDFTIVRRDKRYVTSKTKQENMPPLTSHVSLSAYGSRGEQRLAILWLKLAEFAFIEEKVGERPILLLDDIFSELDKEHRVLVLDVIGKQQTIITSAEDNVRRILDERGGKTSVIELPLDRRQE